MSFIKDVRLMKLNATRMALREVKHRLTIAQRGHRLLKDKQDALIQNFMSMSESAKILRRQVDAQFQRVNEAYQIASIESDDESLHYYLNQSNETLDITRGYQNILSLHVPVYDIPSQSTITPSDDVFGLHSRLVDIQSEYESLTQRLVQLAQEEAACFVLGEEIKKTRRRVNALEFKTIPAMQSDIRRIEIQIEDQDRAQLSRIMQVK